MKANQLATKATAIQRMACNSALLLIASGVLVGLGFPLAKLATQSPMPAPLWVMLNSIGASIALFMVLMSNRGLRWFSYHEFRYAVISGPITFAGPSILVFTVVPEVGAAFSGILFSLSPLFTLLFARICGVERLSARRSLGVAIGLCGAVGISISKGAISPSGQFIWLALAFSIPILLAFGNLYRTLDWPENSPPELLAFWSHIASSITYLALTLLYQWLPFADKGSFWTSLVSDLSLGQLILGGLTAPLVFRLQRIGGPVMISQIGYVAAGTSMVIATLFLAERYPLFSWLSTTTIFVGLAITISASQNKT